MSVKRKEEKRLIAEAKSIHLRFVGLESELKRERIRLRESVKKVRNVKRAQEVFQAVAQQIQNHAHTRISSVVSRCLSTVFEDEAYEFRIEFVRRRGKTDAVLTFEKDGVILQDPTFEMGVGMIEVAAFALRLACLMLSLPKKRRVLILDEPFKGLHSPVFRERMAKLIMTLSHEMKVQFIIVTGIKDYEIGKVISL